MKHLFEEIGLYLKGSAIWEKGVFARYFNDQKTDEQMWISLIDEALQDWKAALNNFNYFSEEDLVDYSIFSINAAEKRYMHLIRKARELNVLAEGVPITMTGEVQEHM